MSRTLNVAVVNGSYSLTGKTQVLVDLIVDHIQSRWPSTIDLSEVARLGPGFTGALSRDELSADVRAHIERVEAADLVIAATSVFRGSYTGLFKHFFDFVGQYALANTPVLLAATGGSDRHTLVIDHELRPLFAFFEAAVAPVGVYASAGDFAGHTLVNPQVFARVDLAVSDIAPWLDRTVASTPEPAAS